MSKNDVEIITALDQLSFELYKGEILGVIGRNGAGKSTLLKVLSQITQPSSGKAEYEGTLTSIIEIGTGFHPDLSGKENVYLSASLLRQSKSEIDVLYDSIVDFSELEEFMEMPVKHFSSGMYLRLAFAVAFYSKIDILLLDEVIAVGDASFRRKCYQKIRDLKNSGVAIILVSHSMENIIEFCDRCILLSKGKLELIAKPLQVIEVYLEGIEAKNSPSKNSREASIDYLKDITVEKIGPFQLTHFNIDWKNKKEKQRLLSGNEISIELIIESQSAEDSIQVAYELLNMNDLRLFLDSYALREDYVASKTAIGKQTITCIIPANLLNSGFYYLGIIISRNGQFEKHIEKIVKLRIHDEALNSFGAEINSIMRPRLHWEIKSGEAC
ncbi:MAG: ATP-binding cassette domain-containing protein [Flavobacteriales bacterium]|nr:ATP-binding cassette domain-containing protein [Flavobacteriales bacterium]